MKPELNVRIHSAVAAPARTDAGVPPAAAQAPNISARTFLFSGRRCGYVEDPEVIAALDRAYASTSMRRDCDVENYVPVLSVSDAGCSAAQFIEDVADEVAGAITAQSVLAEATADVIADLAMQPEFAHVSMQALIATAAAALASSPTAQPLPVLASAAAPAHAPPDVALQSHGPDHLCPRAAAAACPGCSASKAHQVVHRHGAAPRAAEVGGRVAFDSFGPTVKGVDHELRVHTHSTIPTTIIRVGRGSGLGLP